MGIDRKKMPHHMYPLINIHACLFKEKSYGTVEEVAV